MIIGEAITDSGPAIVISFVLAGVTCIFSALCYSELASTLPVSGSAYTYAYATMGELIAWIIGWDLILEYGVSVAAVAVGWGAYLKELLESLFSISLPASIADPPGEGGSVNLPAVFLVLGVAALLIAGIKESARTNTVMVITKIAVLLFFIAVAFTAFNGDHFSNFARSGFSGIETAAALIFFAGAATCRSRSSARSSSARSSTSWSRWQPSGRSRRTSSPGRMLPLRSLSRTAPG